MIALKTNLILFIAMIVSANAANAMETSKIVVSYEDILKINKFKPSDLRYIEIKNPITTVEISINEENTSFLSLPLNKDDNYEYITLKRTKTNIEIIAEKNNCWTPDQKKALATLTLASK